MEQALPEIDWNQALIGVGRWKNSLSELTEGISESQVALRGSGEPGIYYYGAEKGARADYDYRTALFQIQTFIREGEVTKAQKRALEVFDASEAEDAPLPLLQTFSWVLLMGGHYRENVPFSFYETRWKRWEELMERKGIVEERNYLLSCREAWHPGPALAAADYAAPSASDPDAAGRQPAGRIRIPENNPYIRDSLNYMLAHYAEELSLDGVAADIDISSFYLSRLFRQELERTFLEVLTDIRFTHVMEMLYKGEENIQQISWKAGYGNVSYFYRLFKKKMGMTAGEMKGYLGRL